MIPFPFGLPGSTIFYIVLFVVTLAIHVVFMNYVLAGAGYLAWGYLTGARKDRSLSFITLRDWLPGMLSGAITAGVAPLLFIQILYEESFYTSNLLLFHRWMLILPVLILAFYGCYLLKGKWLTRRPALAQTAVAAIVFICFAFVGYSWSENHLLMMRQSQQWGEFYQAEAIFHYESELVPRLLLWGIGAIPTMALLVSWQVWYKQRHGDSMNEPPTRAGDVSRNSMLAIVGLGLAVIGGGVYIAFVPGEVRAAFFGGGALIWLILAGLGLALQVWSWIKQIGREQFSALWLTYASVGMGVSVAGMTMCRECARVVRLGEERMQALYQQHADALQVGGLPIFLFFFLLNAAVIGYVFLLVKKNWRDAPAS